MFRHYEPQSESRTARVVVCAVVCQRYNFELFEFFLPASHWPRWTRIGRNICRDVRRRTWVCRDMTWDGVVEMCRGLMSWDDVVEMCRGVMSWDGVVEMCRGVMSWSDVV